VPLALRRRIRYTHFFTRRRKREGAEAMKIKGRNRSKGKRRKAALRRKHLKSRQRMSRGHQKF
jgi:hypothetical protein